VAVSVVVFAFTDPLVNALGLSTEQGIEQPSLAYGIFSALTAGVTEAVLFRGYPIERFVEAGYQPAVAGAVTWAVFTLAHAVSGYPLRNVVQIAALSVVITAV